MRDEKKKQPLEWWGGVEPTINRVGDRFLSQLERNGHRSRLSDLDRFAELGLTRLRFPVLWEEVAPSFPYAGNWEQIDIQLERTRSLGLNVTAGLVHHGSGPRYTSLIDPLFAEKLARFAREVAERYPWIDAFTPVNEPLTTARFSGLYGVWYPHGRDGFTFARTMLNQCRAVVLAMREIRVINPEAKLLQTDDLGKTYARSKLSYQAEFENERRWLTWDLLCGRVNRDHPMWSYLLWLGVGENEIAFFEENPCPPDMIGVNHYVTSERFLDDKLRHHPAETHGGNGRHQYADVAAVRVRPEGITGPEALLREACDRYSLPVAVTEAHLGCTREEQLRWLEEFRAAAVTLRAEGRDICAITVWSLLGAFDWNSLLTREENNYEPGAFDLRSTLPRATAVAQMVGKLARGEAFNHPTLTTPGWWRRPIRLIESVARDLGEIEECCPTRGPFSLRSGLAPSTGAGERPILFTGGAGRLAQGFALACELRGLAHRVVTRESLDIADETALQKLVESEKPWAVVNCAGFSNIDRAEEDEESCKRANVSGAEILSAVSQQNGIPLVTFSSDHVFDGESATAYAEGDATHPLNIFGECKALAEEKVLATNHSALIVRLGKLFGPDLTPDSLRSKLQSLERGERVQIANDIRFSASYLPDVVNATLDLLIDEESGVWHLANSGGVTPAELLKILAHRLDLDVRAIEGVPVWSLQQPARRARHRVLRSERGQLLPPLENAIERYIHDSPPIGDEADRLVAAR